MQESQNFHAVLRSSKLYIEKKERQASSRRQGLGKMLIDIYRRDLFCTIMHGGRAFFPWMGDIGTNLILAPPPRTTAIYGCGGGRRKEERRLFCLHGRRRNIFFGSSNRGRSNTREKNGMPFIGRFVRESLLPLLRQRAFEIHYHGGNGGPQ